MRRITRLPYAADVSSPLPLFCLSTVLVPGLVLPLHVFEPRYRTMVEDLLAISDEEQREFGVIAVREGRDAVREGLDALYPVGTATILRQADRTADGRYDIVTTGSRRFRLLGVTADARAATGGGEPLLVGDVEFLDDPTDPTDQVLAAQVATAFHAYRAVLGGQVSPDATHDDDLPDDPTVLSYLVTAAMVLPPAERQDLLAAASTGERLTRARRLLRRETGLVAALSALPALDQVGPSPSAN
jgi:uncharacterized protein